MKSIASLSIATFFSFLLVAPLQGDEAAAIAAIQKLGGSVMQISADSPKREVSFQLARETVGDDQLALVKEIKNVVWLNLKGAAISDNGLLHLAGLAELERLHLEKTAISDEGLKHLGKLNKLVYLNLYGTQVSDEGLQHLEELKSLKKLYVWQSKVTPNGMERLQKSLPEIEIVGEVKLAPVPEFVSIFDGKSLAGWKGAEGFWTVEDGAITGRTTAEKPTAGNTFLVWQDGTVGDFELKLKFKIENGNSGIQFRSTDLKNFVVGGYQADIDAGNNYTGILYEEKGRGILAKRMANVTIASDGKKTTGPNPTGDEAKLLESLKKDSWHTYEVYATGDQIEQVINGFTTVKVVDQQKDKAKPSGILALQLHAGPPMKVQFKDIMLKRFDTKQ